MKPQALQTWAWVLLYGGLLLLTLGLFVQRQDEAMGVGLQVVGAVGAVLGILLIWLRARMKDESR